MNVTIKHQAKSFSMAVALDESGRVFKEAISSQTGIPVERMKVMIKGILKDDTDMSSLGLKPNQVITVIGSATALPQAPAQPTEFHNEEMTIARVPPGLVNLGNTCYLNSTLQALHSIPELQKRLASYPSISTGPHGRLASSMKNLFSAMDSNEEPLPPAMLLEGLQTIAPQFAERDQRGIPAQQDAEEAWTQLVQALRDSLSDQDSSFVDEWMSLELTKTLSSPEAPEEQPSVSKELALKLECNISGQTNFLMSGILDGLNQQIEKNSPSLSRSAVYDAKSRLSRLPAYLTIHMVRFFWRRDIQGKAKIMRKVAFPLQLDVLDLATDELREKLQPVNNTVKQILKARDERATIAKRSRGKGNALDGKKEEDDRRDEERKQIAALVAGSTEVGANPSGMYELCAMVTHKGASADSGHYIGWARKSEGFVASGDEEWYKFDDDKVSVVTADQIQAMAGGGEASVAYLLLYRAVQI